MDDALFDAVAALPLDVRLALLKVDPDGPGVYIKKYNHGEIIDYADTAEEAIRDDLYRYGDPDEPRSHTWLPRNPIAAIEVAVRILAQRHGLPPSIELLGPDEDDGWTCRLVIARGTVEAKGSRAEIGVRALVGVVNAR